MVTKTIPQASPTSYTPPPQGEWTYDDYARLPDNGMRYEVIKGELYMTPAPIPKHQRAVLYLSFFFSNYLMESKLGEIYIAPIDLILPNRATPVQPDLLFIPQEKLSMVKEKFIEGIPDLIIEILSPGSETQDRRIKFNLYAEAGVPEYWLVEPQTCTIEVYVLRGQAYALLAEFAPADTVRSEVLPGFGVQVGEVCG